MAIKNILCVCHGNSDRSPAMAAVLSKFLAEAGRSVNCNSAGISESAGKGGNAPRFAINATNRIGVNLTAHIKQHISSVNLKEYDLIVCASDGVAGKVAELTGRSDNIYNAQISNPWPYQFQEDYDRCFEDILAKMYRVVARYFP